MKKEIITTQVEFTTFLNEKGERVYSLPSTVLILDKEQKQEGLKELLMVKSQLGFEGIGQSKKNPRIYIREGLFTKFFQQDVDGKYHKIDKPDFLSIADKVIGGFIVIEIFNYEFKGKTGTTCRVKSVYINDAHTKPTDEPEYDLIEIVKKIGYIDTDEVPFE